MMMQDKHAIPITILICADDAGDRLRMQQALEDAHIINDLRFVEDGEQLLDYLQRRGAYAGETGAAPRPGLILLDFEMPQMDEGTVLERIKRDPTIAGIPMAILTTSRLDANDAEAIESRRLGASSFITKPVTFLGLVDAMNALGRYWLEIVESPPVP